MFTSAARGGLSIGSVIMFVFSANIEKLCARNEVVANMLLFSISTQCVQHTHIHFEINVVTPASEAAP